MAGRGACGIFIGRGRGPARDVDDEIDRRQVGERRHQDADLHVIGLEVGIVAAEVPDDAVGADPGDRLGQERLARQLLLAARDVALAVSLQCLVTRTSDFSNGNCPAADVNITV